MTLQACGRPGADRPASPAAIAVEIRDQPPADLMACADRPEGFPADAAGVLPASVRAALARIAIAFGANADRQDRLINWQRPGTCPAGDKSNG